nr:retrovirus-related Pol polyprotein from transposon TNT 1-94 [Tanacetum cinerariifolium]
MSRDVLTVGSTMRIPLLYRGEYSQWVERFMNYLEEQTDREEMINSIKNGDQPLPRVTQVSIAGTSSIEQPPLKDKSMCNKTTKDLWDALAIHMLGSEYGEQDRKDAVLYEYEMVKATEGELLLDTYIRYLQVINDLKKCGYLKDNCELNFKFLNNLQQEWKQYAIMMRQNKNLMDINIDALYNILKQNQGDVNDATGLKKKTVVVTSDPLALIAEKTKVSKRKEKVVASSDSEGSDADDFSELKKIIALLANAFNRRKFYSKPTNNNLRTSSTSQSANKKQEFVKTDDKKVKKKDDEKKRDMSKKDKDEQFLLAEDQAWMESRSDSDQEINANIVFMAQIKKVLSDSETSSSSADDKNSKVSYYLSESESESEYENLEYYDNTTTYEKYAKLEAERYEYMIRYSIYFDNDKQHKKQIADQEVLYDKMSVQFVELDKHFRDLKNTVLERDFKISKLEEYVRNMDLEIEKCLERLNVCENKIHKMGQTNQTIHMIMPSKDTLYNGRKGIGFENPSYFEKAKDLRPSLYDEKVIGLGYTSIFLTHSDEALEIEKFKRTKENKFEFAYDYRSLNTSYVNEKIIFSKDYFQEIINPYFDKIYTPFQQTSSLKPYVSTVILEKIIIYLEDEVVSLLQKEKENLKTIESLKSNDVETGVQSSEKVVSETENQSENYCQVVEKECDNVENSKVIAPGMFKLSLPKMKFKKDHLCFACEQGKIHQKHHKSKTAFASNKPLYLLHMDLCGPMRVESINGKRYVLVVVDDYSWYTWVFFLQSKDEASNVIIYFIKKTQGNLQLQVQRVRTDNGMEFKNKTLAKFFDEVGITQQFFAARTPQQNGIVERRNRTLVEAARTILSFVNLPLFLWAEAIATACFTQNRSIIHKCFDKTPYELMNKRKPNIKFFRVFGCKCYLLNDYENVGKLKGKGDIRVFVGYSKEYAAFRIYNKRTCKIHEIVNVNFDEISEMASKQFNLELGLSNLNEMGKSSNPSVSQVSETSKKDLEDLFQKFYDEYFDASKIMKSSTMNVETSNVEIPSHEEEVFHESSESFQEESSSSLLNDEVQQIPEEVILPQTNTRSISNNMIPNVDEASTSHNVFNERLEDAYFDASTSFHDSSNVNTFYQPYPHEKKWTKDHPLHKIIGDPKSSVRTRGQLAYSCLLSFIEPTNVAEALRDADWTSFLNEILKEEVYVGQPLGFVSKQYPDHVYDLDKALYGLKQSPWTWYDVLSQFSIYSGFQKDVDNAGCHLDRKSTSGSIQFLGDKLVCWSSKKQNCVSISTTESEYVAVSSCCAQVLWMRTQLTDYGFFYDKVPIYCDSKSAIAIRAIRTGIDLPRSLPSNLGKLGLGDGV